MCRMLWSLVQELWLLRGWCWPAGIQGCVCSLSVILLPPHGLQPARLLPPWNAPGKSTARQGRVSKAGCRAPKVWGRFQGCLVQGTQSWDGWSFKGLKAACLLVGKAVSPPGQLLVLSCLSTGANKLVGPSVNKLDGLQDDTCQYQCLCSRTSSQKWLLPLSVSPG